MALASRKTYQDSNDGKPYHVIIEDPETFPFASGERERDWREATDEEYAEYVAYWNARYDEETSDRPRSAPH